MSLRALFRVELGRLLCGRLTWLAVAATLLGPLEIGRASCRERVCKQV